MMNYRHTDSERIDPFSPSVKRYDGVSFKQLGNSGLQLPLLSLGLWHNFGDVDDLIEGRKILRMAFNHGITHFDLANNYGPPYGAAETNFGKIFKADFRPFRDELIISSKAGYDMWDGPYGNGGSRKYLMASLDQSLRRLGLEYVDIFYHHRPDPYTPMEETMLTLDHIVRQGKALYVGISNYDDAQMVQAYKFLSELGTPFVVNQVKYSMLNRWIEKAVLQKADDLGLGLVAFSPLAEGLLTDKYLKGIPEKSRASKKWGHLQQESLTPKLQNQLKQLNDMALKRGQSLAQLALVWILRNPQITSVLIGTSSVKQLQDNLSSLENKQLSSDEIKQIDELLKS